MPARNLLLISPDETLQHRLVAWLPTQPDLALAGWCASLENAVARCFTAGADVLLVDYGALDIGGPTSLEVLRQHYQSTPIVVILSGEPTWPGGLASSADAVCYLPRTISGDSLFAVLRTAINQVLAPANETDIAQLSEKELEVLRLIADGLSNRQIAERLEISVYTVKHRVTSILIKLGLKRRTQVAIWAREHERTGNP